MSYEIPKKTKTVLWLLSFALLFILGRVAFLTLFKQEYYQKLAKGPKETTLLLEADRGTIRDRNNQPLVVNQIAYDITVSFDKISHFPRVQKIGGIKVFPRKEYIGRLVSFLEDILKIDKDEIEDTIYKSALFPNTPFALKEEVDEITFYKIKFAEKDFPGLEAKIRGKRFYPHGATAFNLLGSLGLISANEYAKVLQEKKFLKEFLEQRNKGFSPPLPEGFTSISQIKEKLVDLQKRGFHLNSRMGKEGIEKQFDAELRGFCGKDCYEMDVKGRFIRKLPESSIPTPGKRVLLSISLELQKMAEELLIESEKERDDHFLHSGKDHHKIAPPWIKGGTIVAMNPKTFEVLAMATYPRMDPKLGAKSWIENEKVIGEYFDGVTPLKKERLSLKTKEPYYEEQYLTYEKYLDSILSLEGTTRRALDQLDTIGKMLYLQKGIQRLLEHFEQYDVAALLEGLFPDKGAKIGFEVPPYYKPIKDFFDLILKPIAHKEDRLLLLRLVHLFAPQELFDEGLAYALHDEPISHYRALAQEILRAETLIKKRCFKQFLANDFKVWRKTFFQDHLALIRKRGGKRPYLDYLKEIESTLFATFFEKYRSLFIQSAILGANIADPSSVIHSYCEKLSQEGGIPLLKERLSTIPAHLIPNFIETIRSYQHLDPAEKILAKTFFPKNGYGYGRHIAVQETAPLGSIYKIIPALAGLKKHLQSHTDFTAPINLNPLTIRDEGPKGARINAKTTLGFLMDGTPITRQFKGGRLPRSDHPVGVCDLEKAIEMSSNIYFSLLADYAKEELIEITQDFGFGQKTGIELPIEAEGYIPKDIYYNKSGLYSLAIGQHSLTVTPLQTAVMLSSLANAGSLKRPTLLRTIVGFDEVLPENGSLYSRYLKPHFLPSLLFTEAEKKRLTPSFLYPEKRDLNSPSYPKELLQPIFKGLHRVINGERGGARPEAIRYFQQYPLHKKNYRSLQPHLIGKTGTAQILYNPCLDKECAPLMVKHIWFGVIYYNEEDTHFESPELVVVVFLRYGYYGKDAVPPAIQLIQGFKSLK